MSLPSLESYPFMHKNAALGSGRLVFMAEMGDSLETRRERKSDDIIVKEVLFSLLGSLYVCTDVMKG
jgi:hypothetical protein